MANTFRSGTIYVDTASAQLYTGPIKVTYITFTTANSNDAFTINDGTSGSDPIKLNVKQHQADTTVIYDYSRNPIIFQTGIYCSALSTGAIIMIQTTTQGAS